MQHSLSKVVMHLDKAFIKCGVEKVFAFVLPTLLLCCPRQFRFSDKLLKVQM